jgi:hypothetical protein
MLTLPDDYIRGVELAGEAMELVDDWKNGRMEAGIQGPLTESKHLQVAKEVFLDCPKGLNPSDYQWKL